MREDGLSNRRQPEVGFEEIAIDLLEGRFLRSFLLTDDPSGSARYATSGLLVIQGEPVALPRLTDLGYR
jgi:hypothetical protein